MNGGHASGTSVVAVTVVFTALAATFVASRTYARLRVARNPGLDDVAIVFATLFAVGTTITMLFQVRYGMGRRQATLTVQEGVSMLQAFYVSIWMYNLSLSCTKIAILLQYLRVFSPMKAFRVCCYTLLGIVVVYSLYTFFTAVFACTPIAYFWNPLIEGGTCLPRFPIWFANAGINIATDIAIAILPIPVLSKLELPKRTKRALITVFLLGGFTCIVSMLRLQSLYVVSQATDISWNNPLAAVWSNIEINTAIMCSCLPTLRCIFPRIFKSRISQPRSWSNGGGCREEDGGLKLKFFKKFHLKRSQSTISEGTSLEAGGLDRENLFPHTDLRSGDDFGHLAAMPGESRTRRPIGEADGRIMVSKAIEQEVEIRADLVDDPSTKDLIVRQH